MSAASLPSCDLARVADGVGPLWNVLDGATLLLTGGTGFFGNWLLESLLFASDRWNIRPRILAVTRDTDRAAARFPHLSSSPLVHWIGQDVTRLLLANETPDYVVHSIFAPAALSELQQYYRAATECLIRASTEAAGCLLCSTGAVYRPSAGDLSESSPCFGAEDPLSYPVIRAEVEDLWMTHLSAIGRPCTIARGFAFVGPRLPLDGQFAVGNFLRDLLAGHPICIRGDGSAVRSYLHASDLTIRLWHLLLGGRTGTFNVGSRHPVSIRQVADVVSRLVSPPAAISVLGENFSNARYVPDPSLLESSFQLPPALPLSEAIDRTWQWLVAQSTQA